MRTLLLITVFISFAVILIVFSCKRYDHNCYSESLHLKKRIAKSWKLYKVLGNNCSDKVADNVWFLELSRTGDSYSISKNIFGEQEADIGKWDLANDGKILQINNFFFTSKTVFISNWYKILKLSENEMWLESSFNDKEVFCFISMEK